MQHFNSPRYNSPNRNYSSPRHGGGGPPPRGEHFNSPYNFTPPRYEQQWRPQQQQQHGGNRNHQMKNSPRHFKNNNRQGNSGSIESYFKPSMLENPWKKLEDALQQQQQQEQQRQQQQQANSCSVNIDEPLKEDES